MRKILDQCTSSPVRQNSKSKYRKRSGAVLVAVLTCVLVVVALVGVAMKSTLSSRRQCKLELQMQQAEILLHAGMDRLRSERLKGDSDPSNEQSATLPAWDVRAAFPEFAIAEVVYSPARTEDGAKSIIRCTARLGVSASAAHAIQLSRDLVLDKQSDDRVSNATLDVAIAPSDKPIPNLTQTNPTKE